MKKRLIFLILPVLLFTGGAYVDAASVSVKCNNTTVGTETTCTISISGAGQVNAIEGKISMSGTSLVSKTNGSGWQGDIDSSSISLYGDPHSGSFTVATLTMSAKNVGRGTINLSNMIYYNENFDQVSLGSASGSFTINQVTTKAPIVTNPPKTTTTTKPVTKPITTKAPVTTQVVTTNPLDAIELKLDTVSVEDYEVTTSGGIYYVTVDSTTTEVLVSATAHESLTIIGTGKRTLVNGRNSVELIVRNYKGDSQTYQIIITKPNAVQTFDTKLTKLKIANYAINFSPDILEYTISVPYNTNEIYVEAEGQSPDVIIQGAGMISLSGKTTDVIVNSSYGDLQSTTYVIHVKKSYGLLVMWIVIGTLGLGLGASLIYANINRKAAVSKAVAEKNREIAIGNRQIQMNSANANVSVGGASVEGTGIKTVVPTRVVQASSATPAQVANGIVESQNAISAVSTPITRPTQTVKTQQVVQPVKVVKKVVGTPQTRVVNQAAQPTVVKTVVKPVTVVHPNNQ